MFSLTHADGHLLSTDPARIDLDLVHHWLSTDAYWALGRDRETTARAFAGSLPFGVYRPEDGRQVAVARVVTDGATFAWLCDVYVDRPARGKGLGGWLASAVRDHLAERGVRRILLTTYDAHEVYARVGFTPLDVPQRWMQLDRRSPVTPITGKEQSSGMPLTVEP
ncbi:GNAT family N-acetyltransferase [Micromonospora tarensis]|uniref:GNAT family N-acetyltransferase n=1 Tax=Micromonospora tarensis TaxID=2806100 RepID=A0ABS1YHX3_9ACTN|nr:GNAT family N-acetyltransferase [Micromonospora tarensis]MBM0277022.1 GNAT family N-acetyltransferase [Micromonospora tarensis]